MKMKHPAAAAALLAALLGAASLPVTLDVLADAGVAPAAQPLR